MGEWGAVQYETDTIYKAVVNTNKTVCRIYFKFCWNGSKKMVWIAQSTDGILSRIYYIDTATEVHHVTNEGVWKMSLHKECSPTWVFVQNDGYRYSPTISLAHSPKEVKSKMAFEKRIFHIMFFNKKTEQIDFKQYIPAKDTQAAVMIAAQTYKDYVPNIHMVLVKTIDYSEYTPIKE